MHAWLLNLLLLANTFMLALPPGMCCRAWLPADEVAPAAKGCCHGHEHSPADASPAPAPLAQDCRCPREAVTTASKTDLAKPQDQFAQGSTPIPVISPEPVLPLAAGRGIERIQDPGPSLQILHCVWRC